MTLIEVLIAITLVALLSVGMLFSLRAGLGSVETIRRHVLRERRATNARRVLEQEFANLLAVVAPCGAGPAGTAMAPGVSSMFFEGTPDAIRFVTSYSLDGGGRGAARIAEIFPIAGEGGAVRLVLNERPYSSPFSAGVLCQMQQPTPGNPPLLAFAPVEPSPRSFVLADRLASVHFAFRPAPSPLQPEQWLPRWPNPLELPAAVRIEMVPVGESNDAMAPMPFYARVVVNRRTDEPLEH
jgi:hypothetical protein